MLTNTFSQYIFNGKKWGKASIIAREFWTFKVWGNALAILNPIPESEKSSSPIRSESWSYESKISLPQALVEQGGLKNTQDVFTPSVSSGNDEGLVATSFDYELVELESAISYTNETTHRSVYTNGRTRLDEHSSLRYQFPNISQFNLRSPKFVSGLTANLYGTTGMSNGNFGHWVFDGLSRIFLIDQHYKIEDFDHFLVPPQRYDFHSDSLDKFGISAGKIIELQAMEPLQFERLVTTTAPRGYASSVFPGYLIDSYRARFLDEEELTKPKRRLYISRRDASGRNFTNELDVIEALETLGFEEIQMSKYSFCDKIKLFSEAEFIVGLSGAGLTSLMFCQPNCKVVELFPDNELSYIYASIASYLNLKYSSFIFSNQSAINQVNRYYGNFTLDPESLLSVIRKM